MVGFPYADPVADLNPVIAGMRRRGNRMPDSWPIKRPVSGGAGSVISIQCRRRQAKRRKPARHVAHIPNLRRRKRSAEQRRFPVGQPLLQHLIATDREVPDRVRNIAPVSIGVEVDIAGLRAQQSSLKGRLGAYARTTLRPRPGITAPPFPL